MLLEANEKSKSKFVMRILSRISCCSRVVIVFSCSL